MPDMSKTKWKDIEVSSLQEFNAETHRITIESIQQAMNELLRTKTFREITISDLVKKAGVSRSAFYRNYQSKEEVLQSIVYDSFAELSNEIKMDTDHGQEDLWRLMLLKNIEQCRKFYNIRKADAWQGDTLLQCMNEYLGDFFLQEEAFAMDEMQMRFWMGGIYNTIQYWIDNGMKESPETLADRLLGYMIQHS